MWVDRGSRGVSGAVRHHGSADGLASSYRKDYTQDEEQSWYSCSVIRLTMRRTHDSDLINLVSCMAIRYQIS